MRWISIIVIVFSVSPVCADFQEFEDKQSWELAVSAHYTSLTFSEFPPPPPQIFMLNQYAHYGAVFTDGSDPAHHTSSYVNDGAGVFGDGSITIHFNQPQNWIGADYPGGMQISLYNNGDVVFEGSNTGAGGSGFFSGIVSKQSFDKIVLTDWTGGTVSIDDVHFGPSVASDLTHDTIVGPDDLGELLAQWGPCAPDTPCSADLDESGGVGPADLAQLLAGWSKDCNDNREFDHFEIITQGDCNDSGLPDLCDVAAGTSLDCNANNVPDECELELLQPVYGVDDGENEFQVTLTADVPFVWLNAFTVEKGGEVIDRVLAAWGVGPVTVALWTDPNDDGIPHDAELAALIENVPLTFPIGGPFRTIEIPPTYVGEAGEKFFVGLMIPPDEDGEYPAWLDADTVVPGQSWFWIDLDLDGALPQEDAVPGTWMIRAGSTFNNDADGNGVPDDCD